VTLPKTNPGPNANRSQTASQGIGPSRERTNSYTRLIASCNMRLTGMLSSENLPDRVLLDLAFALERDT